MWSAAKKMGTQINMHSIFIHLFYAQLLYLNYYSIFICIKVQGRNNFFRNNCFEKKKDFRSGFYDLLGYKYCQKVIQYKTFRRAKEIGKRYLDTLSTMSALLRRFAINEKLICRLSLGLLLLLLNNRKLLWNTKKNVESVTFFWFLYTTSLTLVETAWIGDGRPCLFFEALLQLVGSGVSPRMTLTTAYSIKAMNTNLQMHEILI